MNKLIITTVLLGLSPCVMAVDISSPSSGVVCDKKSGFCVDYQGISMGFTELYLGKVAMDKLQESLGDDVDVILSEYTFSNGVYCDSKERQCYKDRYYPRTLDKRDNHMTKQIFGKK